MYIYIKNISIIIENASTVRENTFFVPDLVFVFRFWREKKVFPVTSSLMRRIIREKRAIACIRMY